MRAKSLAILGILAQLAATGCAAPRPSATTADASAVTALDAPADAAPAAVEDAPADIPLAPPPCQLTVNAIPAAMNGSVPYAQANGAPQDFRLRVPRGGFSIDLYSAAGAPWPGTVEIRASSALGATDPGFDLVPQLACTRVPDPVGWPDEKRLSLHCEVAAPGFAATENLTLTGQFVGADGQTGAACALGVAVAELPAKLDPFAKTDAWLVTLSRDLFAHKLAAAGDGTYALTTTYVPAGNGKADLDEALEALGLLSSNAAFSQQAKARFLARLRAEAYRLFQLDDAGMPTPNGPNLRLVFEGDAGTLPQPHSVIALGGDPDADGLAQHLVGYAHVDLNNQHPDDNTAYGWGVFLTAVVRMVLSNPAGAALLQEISPLDGQPLGTVAGDELLLDPTYTPPDNAPEQHALRASLARLIWKELPVAVASALCHEIGHSLGLVPDGAPPVGLFGGLDDLPFTLSNPGSHHIDTAGLNVMQTGKVTNPAEMLTDLPRFNQLNMAYLRRRLVVGSL